MNENDLQHHDPSMDAASISSSNIHEIHETEIQSVTQHAQSGIVVVKTNLNEGKVSLRIYIVRFILSVIFIFLVTLLLQLVFQLFNTAGSSTVVNFSIFFGLKLPYVGLLNAALLCFSIIPSFFGYTPSVLVMFLTFVVISGVTVGISFAAAKYEKWFLVVGLVVQIICIMILTFVTHWIYKRTCIHILNCLEKCGIHWPTKDKILSKIYGHNNIANPDTLTMMRKEMQNIEEKKRHATGETSVAENEARIDASTTPTHQFAQLEDQLRAASPDTPHSPNQEENDMQKWERKRRQRDKKNYNRNMRIQTAIAVTIVLIVLYLQLCINILLIETFSLMPMVAQYLVVVTFWPVLNGLFKLFISTVSRRYVKDTLFMEFQSYCFAIYPYRFLIFFVPDWYMFGFMLFYEFIIFKIGIYFLPSFKFYFIVYDRLVMWFHSITNDLFVKKKFGKLKFQSKEEKQFEELRRRIEENDLKLQLGENAHEPISTPIETTPTPNSPPVENEDEKLENERDERYEKYVKKLSRRYYLLTLIDCTSTISALIFFSIFGYNFDGVSSGYLTILFYFCAATPFQLFYFFLMPPIVRLLTRSNFKPFTYGQPFIHNNIFRWFLTVTVATLSSYVVLESQNINNLWSLH